MSCVRIASNFFSKLFPSSVSKFLVKCIFLFQNSVNKMPRCFSNKSSSKWRGDRIACYMLCQDHFQMLTRLNMYKRQTIGADWPYVSGQVFIPPVLGSTQNTPNYQSNLTSSKPCPGNCICLLFEPVRLPITNLLSLSCCPFPKHFIKRRLYTY